MDERAVATDPRMRAQAVLGLGAAAATLAVSALYLWLRYFVLAPG